MNRNDYEAMAEKEAKRIADNAHGNNDVIRSQITAAKRSAENNSNLLRLYHYRVAALLEAHLSQQRPVIIEHRPNDDQTQDGGPDWVTYRLRRTRGMFQVWNQTRRNSGSSYMKPIIGMVVAAVVLGGVINLPLSITLLGMGIAGRLIAERDSNLSRSVGFWLGIMPPALTLLGGMWWPLAIAVAGHYWLWSKPAELQAESANHSNGEGPPRDM